MNIIEDHLTKSVVSEDYNYMFNKKTGFFARWGKKKEDDPEFSPFGPEIVDMEISTICSKGCKWCYKSNTKNGKNMTLEVFQAIFDVLPKTVTQIAFGIGDIDGNPDLWKIMEYCRQHDVVPNITVNGERLTGLDIVRLSQLCGAVSVSCYDNEKCFNTVSQLTELVGTKDTTLQQVNIHKLLSHETYTECMELMEKSRGDVRLKKLNAIVFLWLKPKGTRNTFKQVTQKQYYTLMKYAFKYGVRIGFDSCSAPMFMQAVKGRTDIKMLDMMAESCESTLFSYYINTDGIGFPCSFTEGISWIKGVNLLEVKDFMLDVWHHRETTEFRKHSINSKDCNKCRNCTAYKLGW